VLIYPLLGDALTASQRRHAQAPLLSLSELYACLDAYLPDPAARRDPRALPLAAHDFSGLASAFVAVAEIDPLHDDGLHYVERLRADGVGAQLHRGAGLLHGCLRARGGTEVEALIGAAACAARENDLRVGADDGHLSRPASIDEDRAKR